MHKTRQIYQDAVEPAHVQVTADLVERQFLATADFTREVYDEAALFTDEIDTYTLPKFIKGTSALFVKERSVVRLVGAVTVPPCLG